ncbi:hypothetical protein HA402_009901 [Bradysia odoriphaga]|nr:hypothetical protein HA402_009901 [Bradysia odoriphaga]
MQSNSLMVPRVLKTASPRKATVRVMGNPPSKTAPEGHLYGFKDIDGSSVWAPLSIGIRCHTRQSASTFVCGTRHTTKCRGKLIRLDEMQPGYWGTFLIDIGHSCGAVPIMDYSPFFCAENLAIVDTIVEKTLNSDAENQMPVAKTIIQQPLRRSTSGNNSPSSPLTSQSPKLLLSLNQGPLSLQNYSSQRSRQSSVESQPMNTEEVYRNLRKTTAEIQNYSFETKLDRDSNSKDSGISQMFDQQADHLSLVTGLNGHMLVKKDDSCNGSKPQSATTTESNTVRSDTIDANHKTLTSQKYVANFVVSQTGELIFDGDLEESEIVKTATMLSLDSPTDATIQVLNNLGDCIRHGNCELPIKHFKAIMKALLILVDSPQHKIVIAVIKVLAKIMRSEPMKLTWLNFLEMLLLKIIDCYKMSKETSREIDFILPRIANHLPFEPTFNILYSIIGTGEYPTNLCAIKLLTELVDAKGTGITDKQLDSIMSVLALRTDKNQSMVRKATVFCIVRLYVRLGEERVRPKFSLLNSSKIRLLDVYIAKYQQQLHKHSS